MPSHSPASILTTTPDALTAFAITAACTTCALGAISCRSVWNATNLPRRGGAVERWGRRGSGGRRAVLVDDERARLDEKVAEEAAMAVRRILAVAPHREGRGPRERRQHVDEVPGGRLAHLAPVAALEPAPARRRPRLRHRPGDEGRARRELGEPDVVPVAPPVVGLPDASRRPPDGAE